jgi:hypothetical protein
MSPFRVISQPVGEAELVEQRLWLEIGDPQFDGFAVPDSPQIEDLDDVVRAGHAHIDDLRDPIVLGGAARIAEAREVEDPRQVGQNVA